MRGKTRADAGLRGGNHSENILQAQVVKVEQADRNLQLRAQAAVEGVHVLRKGTVQNYAVG
jgi:hypothetical protein